MRPQPPVVAFLLLVVWPGAPSSVLAPREIWKVISFLSRISYPFQAGGLHVSAAMIKGITLKQEDIDISVGLWR